MNNTVIKTLFAILLVGFIFIQCNNTTKNHEASPVADSSYDYHAEGQKLASSTQSVLGKNLMKAIQENGTEHALEFCKANAISLTDSMANQLNTKIKRVTDKTRNPNNQANAQELAYITNAKKQMNLSGKIDPLITHNNDGVLGYYPIMTNMMCMQCHGNKGEQIKENTLTKLAELYPDDKAYGYGTNELRGIWVVEMDKK